MPTRSKPGLVRHVTGTMGWSRRFWPTPGNRGLRGCPSSEGVSPVRRPKASGVGGSDCAAAAENDLVALDGELLAAALYLRAYGPVAFEDDPVDGAVGPDRQVEPVPGRVQVAQGGAPVDAVGVVVGRGADSRGVRAAMVRAVGETVLLTGVYKKRAGRGASLPV